MLLLDTLYHLLPYLAMLMLLVILMVLVVNIKHYRKPQVAFVIGLYLSSFLVITSFTSTFVEEEVTDSLEKIEYVCTYDVANEREIVSYVTRLVPAIDIKVLFDEFVKQTLIQLFPQPLYILYCRLMIDFG